MNHEFEVYWQPIPGGGYQWYARCQCGWRSSNHQMKETAEEEAACHQIYEDEGA